MSVLSGKESIVELRSELSLQLIELIHRGLLRFLGGLLGGLFGLLNLNELFFLRFAVRIRVGLLFCEVLLKLLHELLALLADSDSCIRIVEDGVELVHLDQALVVGLEGHVVGH